ncbi:OpgC domain-containing protein [Acidipila sp. EB88]|uniref:OpgC domain-containing protein n=1 Tax=Acidipila sp. EB88 TaxID=2305226 RepID=UPI000F5FF764|nr:OpgC domain-containing protein [Acidipila sp. EB88]RRA47111.1 OpgC domain-containing protein [Acidipila sp. EB88]
MRFPKLQRRPELDALRGLFLVWMTLTHLPTRLSEWVNQPFGFLTSAEGFVFLSALLVARIYSKQAAEDGNAMHAKLWRRALKIYGIHVLMLTLAFTVIAALATTTHRAAIYNLLDFYLAHPATAIAGSLLLLYCPPLLDILPLYVLFLAATPVILSWAVRKGWRLPLVASFLLWFGAQVGLREWLHGGIVHLTHLQIPVQEGGAFNLLAWQAIWMAGLYLGAKSAAGDSPLKRINAPIAAGALVVCLFFLGVRHEWLGSVLTPDRLAFQLDKWHIGPLRVLNLVAFTVLFYWLRRFVFRLVQNEPFLTLGKASLEVFCAHIVFVFFALALLYNDVAELHGAAAVLVLVVTFGGLFLLASQIVKRRRAKRDREKSMPPDHASGKAVPAGVAAGTTLPLAAPTQLEPTKAAGAPTVSLLDCAQPLLASAEEHIS